MSIFNEIEATIPNLSTDELTALEKPDSRATAAKKSTESHSVLDILPVSVGKILRPFTSDDDFFDEMLEGGA